MNYKDINTTDKMNKNVKEMLLLKNDNISLYALKRIEELENSCKHPYKSCANYLGGKIICNECGEIF